MCVIKTESSFNIGLIKDYKRDDVVRVGRVLNQPEVQTGLESNEIILKSMKSFKEEKDFSHYKRVETFRKACAIGTRD